MHSSRAVIALLLVVACKSQSKSAERSPGATEDRLMPGGATAPAKPESAGSAEVGGTLPVEGGSDHQTGDTRDGYKRPLEHATRPTTDDEVGQVVAVGSLDQSLIKRWIKKNIPDVNKCYEQAVATNPSLQGTIVTKFTIKPDGSVIDAKASGLDVELGRCVSKVIQQITFPKPKNGDKVVVTYPFQFRLVASAAGSGSGAGSGSAGSAAGAK